MTLNSKPQILVLLLCTLIPRFAHADDHPAPAIAIHPSFAKLRIPHLDQGPTIADFVEMAPSTAFAGKMLKIDQFIQRDPRDGAPVSQRTELYLGYTDNDLYVVCVCFDDQPHKIRGRMVRRELINDDDQFGFVLDTFHDRKHAVFFYLNPMGIQQDGIWLENQEPDYSYDMVWRSDAKLTTRGYITLFEIPFRSLRFPRTDIQNWGVFFERDIRRDNEYAFYPHITSNAQGFLSQETVMSGMQEISPGRNMQFNPYASFRTFRSLDDRDVNNAFFQGKHLEPRLGLDSKVVIKDAIVLDATVNPDFSQVESDEPQITANQRFEVFFPEKRPFFLENSSYFDTPINLVFTRRIADPDYGLRLTGKLGRWSLATLFADDKSPGKSVPSYDPLSGTKAYYSVLRVNHDIGKESSLGFIYTDREMNTVPGTICDDDPCLVSKNRVGGIDTKIKFNSKWSATAQALASATTFNDGTRQAGPAYSVYVDRSSRNLEYNLLYLDNSPGFETLTGFFQRPDIRRVSQFVRYKFRREGKILQWHGPGLFTVNNWDHKGNRLEWFANGNYHWLFAGQSDFGIYGNLGHERLRPEDYDTLFANRDYSHYHVGTFFDFGYFKRVALQGELNFGRETNYDTAMARPCWPAKAMRTSWPRSARSARSPSTTPISLRGCAT